MWRQTFSREMTTATGPSFCSTQWYTAQDGPQAHKHLHLWGQAGSAPQKWSQQVIRSSCEGYTANKRRADNLLRCTLLPTSRDGTVIPGFSCVAPSALSQAYSKAHLSQGKYFHCFQWVVSFIRLGIKLGDNCLEVNAWTSLGWC